MTTKNRQRKQRRRSTKQLPHMVNAAIRSAVSIEICKHWNRDRKAKINKLKIMLKAMVRTDSKIPNLHTKCGEIHYQKSHWCFLCVFCGIDVMTHEEFQSHFELEHFQELMEMLAGPIAIPLLEEETITSSNLNGIVLKADDPLHCEKKISTSTSCNENGHGKTVFLGDCIEDLELARDVNTRDTKNTNRSQMVTAIEENEITNACDEFHGEMDNPFDNESSDNESKFTWNSSSSNTKRPYKPRNKAFACTYCGRTFRRRYQFETHLNIHTGAKPHQCEICGRQFRAVTTLQRHLSTHKQRNFVCKFCNKSFTHKVALLSHETRHTQERNEPCDLCEKRFYTVNQLDTHKRRVHKKSSDILPFACDLCPNRYRTASMLSTHKCRKHYKTAKFECEKCDKKFVDVQRLEEHQKIHVDGLVSSNYINVSKKS